MTASPASRFVWLQLHFTRPVAVDTALHIVRQWALDPQSPRLVLEARATAGRVIFLFGASRSTALRLGRSLAVTVPGTSLVEFDVKRRAVTAAASVRLSTRSRALHTNDPETIIQALLGALATARGTETTVVQLVLGGRRAAFPVSAQATAEQAWWRALLVPAGRLDADARTALRTKLSEAGFRATLRIGVVAATRERRRSLIGSILTVLRTLESPGVRLRLVDDRPARLHAATSPWRWPLRLNSREVLPLLGWPLGERDLPGVAGLHPRLLPLVAQPGKSGRAVALAAAPGSEVELRQDVRGALHHTEIIGPTGAGKSTLLLNLLCQDVAAGRGVVLIEPTSDLVDALLARVPLKRRDDVVLLDPADMVPLGLNPLGSTPSRADVVADGLVATLRSLYADSWGPRTQDILHAGLLTLTRRDDASIVMLPLLLTNPGFRRSLTGRLTAQDPVALGPFWAWYEALSDAERASVIAPVMNKLRPFLYNRRLRAVLGQRQPKIDLPTVLAENKILLVPLRKGIIGAEGARLLGSLVVATLWQAIQGRTSVPSAKRAPVMVYIDELQDYLHLPTDLADALAQARGLGVGFTLAHQYLAQLPPNMRAAVLGTVRSRVCFQLSHDDAVVMAKGHPELVAEDLTSLGAYEVYASLFTAGRVTPYVSGRTVQAARAIIDPEVIRRASRERYGQSLDTVEAGLADLLQPASTTDDAGASGRRRRPS